MAAVAIDAASCTGVTPKTLGNAWRGPREADKLVCLCWRFWLDILVACHILQSTWCTQKSELYLQITHESDVRCKPCPVKAQAGQLMLMLHELYAM